jgi:hypothetical protein
MGLPTTLKENEYLLKIRPKGSRCSTHDTGFMTKYTQKGQMPKSFEDWGSDNRHYYNSQEPPLPITIHIEDFKSGWEIISWRFGMSQNWATMMHPNGFTVEIYLDNLLELTKTNTIKNGILIGEFKWDKNTLIKNLS